ncbi:MAG TPA: exosortase/archaeosortase family protein, partial [Kiritimatiellia bacterium]
ADMAKFAMQDSLYSHVFLIPFIALYLARSIRDSVSVVYSDYPAGFALFVAAGAFLSTIGRGDAQGFEFAQVDLMTITMISFVTCILGAFLVIFGYDAWRAMLFPLLFLYLIAPLPELVMADISHFFQYWSGLAADAMLRMTGTPVYRDGMILQLPGFALEVAEECSGIRASLVLFITSLLAGHMFLRRFVSRFALAASIVPIAIIRNAARIVVLALVTLHVDPEALQGPLHRQGGAPFFVLSLVPLFIILWLLRRSERVRAA